MNQNPEPNGLRRASAAFCRTATLLACGLAASAQPLTTTMSFPVGAPVPDAGTSGLASVQAVSTPITNVTGLKVALKVSGTWSGDLYCFLAHGTSRAVLLNRLGRTSAGNLGYHDAGLEVTFDDAAANGDLHVYRLQLGGSQGPLTGVWAPDARVASPATVLETDARSAFLSSFNGVDPNGEWVLFVADMEAGDLHTLESWGLEITGDTAPIAAMPSLSQSAGTSPESTSVTGTVANPIQTPVGAAALAAPLAPAVLTGLSASAGGVRLTFTGRAGSTYQFERAAGLQGQGTVWSKLGAATTDNAGRGEFTDPHPPAGQGYYRAVGQSL